MTSCVSGTFVYSGALICCGWSYCADGGLRSAENFEVRQEATFATLHVNLRENVCDLDSPTHAVGA